MKLKNNFLTPFFVLFILLLLNHLVCGDTDEEISKAYEKRDVKTLIKLFKDTSTTHVERDDILSALIKMQALDKMKVVEAIADLIDVLPIQNEAMRDSMMETIEYCFRSCPESLPVILDKLQGASQQSRLELIKMLKIIPYGGWWAGNEMSTKSFREQLCPVLIKLLSEYDDLFTKITLIQCLGYLQNYAKAAIPNLYPLLKSEHILIREHAAISLTKITEDVEYLPILLEILQKWHDQGLKNYRKATGEKSWSELHHPSYDFEVYKDTSRTLGQLKNKAVAGVPLLKKILNTTNDEVFLYAARSLIEIEPTTKREVTARLVQLGQNSEDRFLIDAIPIIAVIGPPEAKAASPLLISILNNKTNSLAVLTSTLLVLDKIGITNKEEVLVLCKSLRCHLPPVVTLAERALDKLPRELIIGSLLSDLIIPKRQYSKTNYEEAMFFCFLLVRIGKTAEKFVKQYEDKEFLKENLESIRCKLETAGHYISSDIQHVTEVLNWLK